MQYLKSFEEIRTENIKEDITKLVNKLAFPKDYKMKIFDKMKNMTMIELDKFYNNLIQFSKKGMVLN
jgi:hypothetical protein